MTEGFQPGASSCRNERGSLVTDEQGALRSHHFSTLLRGDGDINAATREDSEPAPIDDNGVEIPPLNYNEVRVAIQRFKNNKAAGPDGLPAELFKAIDDELVRSIQQLICRIRRKHGRKHAQRLQPLCCVSCHEKGRPHDMRQLSGNKPSPIA